MSIDLPTDSGGLAVRLHPLRVDFAQHPRWRTSVSLHNTGTRTLDVVIPGDRHENWPTADLEWRFTPNGTATAACRDAGNHSIPGEVRQLAPDETLSIGAWFLPFVLPAETVFHASVVYRNDPSRSWRGEARLDDMARARLEHSEACLVRSNDIEVSFEGYPDAGFKWYPEVIERLCSNWHGEMTCERLVALRNDLQVCLSVARRRLGIVSTARWVVDTPRRDGATPIRVLREVSPPALSERLVILKAGQLGLVSPDTQRALEDDWRSFNRVPVKNVDRQPSPLPSASPTINVPDVEPSTAPARWGWGSERSVGVLDALGRGPEAVGGIRHTLPSLTGEARHAALRSLSYIGDAEAIEALQQEFDERPDAASAAALCMALPSRGHADDHARLLRAFAAGSRHGNFAFECAVLALGLMRTHDTAAALDAALAARPSGGSWGAWLRRGATRVGSLPLSDDAPLLAAVLRAGVPGTETDAEFVDPDRLGVWTHERGVWQFRPGVEGRSFLDTAEGVRYWADRTMSFHVHRRPMAPRALVSVGILFGALDGAGYDYVVTEDAHEWRVTAIVPTWVS